MEGDDERLQPGLAFDLNEHPRENFNDRWRTIVIKQEGKQHPSLQEESFGSGLGTSYTLKASARRGIICQDVNLLDDADLSICEPHLKAWMQRDYPEEKRSFLYGPAERRGLMWTALQEMSANHAALKVQLNMCAEKAALLNIIGGLLTALRGCSPLLR